MNAKGLYERAVAVTSNNAANVDLFTVDLTAWNEVSADPSGGGNLVLSCCVAVNGFNSTSNVYGICTEHFRFMRKSGTVSASLDLEQGWYGAALGGLGSPNGFTMSVSGNTCKLKIVGIAGETILYDGIVHMEVHY